MDKWIVEYTSKDDKEEKQVRFNSREEAERYIEKISDKCSSINLRYDWGI